MTAKIFLQESQTTRPYASNKQSYIKFRPFLGVLSTKNGQKPYNVTTCNVFLTKKDRNGQYQIFHSVLVGWFPPEGCEKIGVPPPFTLPPLGFQNLGSPPLEIFSRPGKTSFYRHFWRSIATIPSFYPILERFKCIYGLKSPLQAKIL